MLFYMSLYIKAPGNPRMCHRDSFCLQSRLRGFGFGIGYMRCGSLFVVFVIAFRAEHNKLQHKRHYHNSSHECEA